MKHIILYIIHKNKAHLEQAAGGAGRAVADGVGQVAARVLQPRHQLVAELHQAALLVVTRRHLAI